MSRALAESSVVALLGARQTGKTTLARSLLEPRFQYLTLDDPAVADAARADPVAFLSGLREPVILDEAQKAPELFPVIKLLVDRDRRPGRFVLLGSANFLLMRQITESLAGRVALLELGGLSWSERYRLAPSDLWATLLTTETLDDLDPAAFGGPAPFVADIHEATSRGGLPLAALDDDGARRDRWLGHYVQTYLERDLRDLAQVASLSDFRRFMALAALRTAQVLNVSELARDTGISVGTARNWLGLLETSFQIRRLPPLHANLAKRLTKSPKLHLRDSALAWHLSGIADADARRRHPLAPALAESWLVEEIIRRVELSDRPSRFSYFRVHGGTEIDLVIESGDRLLPIEVKSGARIGGAQLKGMASFIRDLSDRAPFGLIAYTGDTILRVAPRCLAVPWSRLLV